MVSRTGSFHTPAQLCESNHQILSHGLRSARDGLSSELSKDPACMTIRCGTAVAPALLRARSCPNISPRIMRLLPNLMCMLNGMCV
jgi:hypothetical protein